MFRPRLGHSQVHMCFKNTTVCDPKNGHVNHKLHMPVSVCEDPVEQNGSGSRIYGCIFHFVQRFLKFVSYG